MAIAKHLMEHFKKVSFEEEKEIIKDLNLKIYINKHIIGAFIGKKKYDIYNRNIYVYNIKFDIKNFSKGDIISFELGDNIKFEFYDSDENTYMYTSEDENNYYSFIGYDTEYNWGNSEFVNDSYPYAFAGDVNSNAFEYYIINNPKELSDYEVDHIINVWIVRINKNDYKKTDREKIYDDIFMKLC